MPSLSILLHISFCLVVSLSIDSRVYFIYLSVCMSIYIYVYFFLHISIHVFICMCLSIFWAIFLFIWATVLSVPLFFISLSFYTILVSLSVMLFSCAFPSPFRLFLRLNSSFRPFIILFFLLPFLYLFSFYSVPFTP